MAIIIGKDSDNNLIGTNRDDWVFGLGGNDTLSGGDGSDKMFGGNGNDSIAGGAGNDWIVGGSGNDSLIGGSGADQLIGGSGQDHFVYQTATDSPAAAGWDRILDFTQGQDKIDLAAFRNSSSDLDLIWKGEDPAIPGAWGVWYHNGPTSTCVYADTNGDGIADLKIELKNTCGLNLVASDFIGVSEVQVNVAPVLDLDVNNSAGAGANYATTFTENGSPVAIADADVGITDVDDTHIVSASITLTNPKTGDSLAAGLLPAGITVDVASTATHVILTGSATLADYQAALKAITFSNSSENPDTTARDVTVVVNDGDANSNTAHTAIAVVAVNDAPTSSDASETTSEDTPVTLGLDDFGSYSDVEGTAIAAVKITTLASNGRLEYDTGGSTWAAVILDQEFSATDINAGGLRFVPDANENGTPYTTVGFRVGDGTDFSTSAYTLTLNVTAANDAPVATDDVLSSVAEDSGTRTITFAELTGNDSDGDAEVAQGLIVSAVSNAVGGTVALVGGHVEFTPTADFNGVASFDYTVQDDGTTNGAPDAKTDIGRASFTVTAFNDPPTVAGLVVTETSISFVASDVDNATLSLTSPFDNAFGNPTITSDATTALTPAQQAPAVSGVLQVTDGTAAANVVGLYLGSSGNNFAAAPLADSPNAMYGFAGSDSFTGGTGADSLYGGSGNDTLAGGGSDLITGDSANDSLLGGSGDDLLQQTRGADSIDGGSNNDRLTFTQTGIVYGGPVGVDVNLAAHTSDYDTSDAGNPLGTLVSIESVTGTAGNDSLVGGDPTHAPDSLGNGIVESFLPLGGNDTITGATGNGFITRADYSTSTSAVAVNLGTGTASDGFGGTDTLVRVDQVFGGSGNDTLLGGSQERSNSGHFLEQFRGGAGNDEINGAGTDTVVGAAGNNQVRYIDSPAAVSVNLGTGTASDGFGGTDTLLNINSVLGSNFNDTLVGGASDHRLIGGVGNDMLVGVTSGVEARYNNATGAVNVSLAIAGPQAVGGGEGIDTLTNIDDLSGSVFNDTLIGNAANNRLAGDPGADTLDGGGGIDFASYNGTPLANGGINAFIENGAGAVGDGFGSIDTLTNIEGLIGTHSGDTLSGGLGDQWFIGRGGSDNIDGGAGSDWVSYINDPAGVTVNLGAPGSATDGWGGVWGFGGNDTLSGIENVEGSQFNDSITGDALANRLEGQGGNDTIVGGAGNDTIAMLVTAGNVDLADGGADNDTLALIGSPGGDGTVTVNLAAGPNIDQVTFANDAPNQTQSNFENVDGSGLSSALNVIGSDSANAIIGSNGNDTIDGGAGDDTIKGGAGADSLAGGADTDTLLYNDSPSRVIVNMLNTGSVVVGADTVLAGTARDGFGTTDTISGFETVVGSAFSDFLQGSTNVVNRLEGGAGNDTLVGSGMSDSIPGAIDDTLLGGTGDDELRQTRGVDHIDGGTGFDRLAFTTPGAASTTGITYGGTTGVNVNLATGTSDYDTSDAGNPLGTLVSIEQVNGTAGNDSFVGGDPAHAPDFLGNRDAEVFRPLGGDDTITGATGNGFFTRVDYSTNTNMQAVSVNLGTGTASDGFGFTDTLVRIDEVIGGAGNDSLLGGSQERGSGGGFREVFRGNSGNDTIDGAGTDTVVGAAGNDRVQYNSSPAAVIVNLMSGTASDGFGFTDTLFNIDEVQGSNFNDTLTGGGEDHRLIGGAGNDSLVGGTSGVEASYIGGTPAGVNANLALGTASDGFGGTDTLVNIDDLRGSDFNDTLTGSAASNVIVGEPGADIIDGGGGIDFASYSSTPLANGGINALIENGSGAVNDGMGSIDTLSNIEGLIGTHSNDTLAGGLGDQWFIGRGGSDSIDGGAGSDWVSYINDPAGVTVNLGAPGSATDGWGGVWGFGGTDTLISIENVEGSRFNDSITGDANANVLDGGTGNDTLAGGASNDFLTGGEGIDTLSYDDSPSRVIVNMFVNSSITIGGITVDPGHAFDGFTQPPVPIPAPTDTISGFETVIGSAFSDFIQGSTNVANLLVGGAGNDTLAGSGSNDGIMPPTPGAANDTLVGGPGNDVLRQSRGNDVIDGGEGSFDALNFLNNGIVYGGAIGVNVNLEAGTSDADPNDGDGVHGAGGDVSAISGIERVDGTAGNDSLVGGDPTHAPDSLGNGIVESFLPLGGNDTITGATGNGFITRAEYSSNTAGQAVIVNLGATPFMVGTVTVQGGTAHDGFGGTDTLVRVDQAFGGSGNDTLLGGSQERSNAGIFLEQFRGGAGNDEINGAGTDTVMGAAGTNQVRYSDSPAAVIVNLGATDFVAGMITVQGGTARDGFIADTVTGAQFTDTLLNINSVLGSNFNDTLVGGASDHRLIGGPGNDLLVGGTSGVEASYNNGTTAVNVNLATGFVSDGQGGSDTLVNIDDLRGSIFNDTLTGNAASNRILGDPGADTIDGGDGIDFASYLSTSLANGGINAFIENGAGLVNDGFGLGSDTLSNIEGLIGTHSNDTLAGGLGDQWFIGRGGSDSIDGGAGSDWVSYINDPAGVTVNLGAPGSATDGWGGVVWALGGIDTLISIENVEGSQFNDSITGDANANVLDGGAGNDTLQGGGGTDTMTGSAGTDTFRFAATSDSSAALAFSDVITDFVHATDKIDLSAIDGIDLFGGESPLSVANSVTWSEDVANTRTILQIDNNGDTAADMQIVLQGTGLGLTDVDFVL